LAPAFPSGTSIIVYRDIRRAFFCFLKSVCLNFAATSSEEVMKSS
jgi:hypothetical protein